MSAIAELIVSRLPSKEDREEFKEYVQILNGLKEPLKYLNQFSGSIERWDGTREQGFLNGKFFTSKEEEGYPSSILSSEEVKSFIKD